MNTDAVRDMLRNACNAAGTQAAWAAKHKLAPTYVSDVLNGNRDPGEKICKALGIEPEVSYRKVKS